MTVDPQSILIRKKVGTSVKPRPRKRQQSLSSSDTTTSIQATEMTGSIGNMSVLSFREARRKRTPTGTYQITIEDYINRNPQPNNFHKTLPTSVLSAVATSKAVDDAYGYLFTHLKGQCHGLNVITYPRVGKDGNRAQPKSVDGSDISSITHFAILVYIQPGTICDDWEKIEEGLVHIFKEAAIKKDGEEVPKWRLKGVVFELWTTKPAAWEFRSGHL
ncbi:uncharacterized protein BHQ10_002430 [Talaromyces amestolkiae]|uniref:Uncharacterized protein n=1 Tax=Talaromyces amestolkiae TaxID=1196081 RepID=A0A364KS99_TALAM|nr:uncharacterized protein BHQ10_002430 [Talaromyces amestolkiae]RAO66418.1 hypothetical protein BHQ10_002430 [Talaromyces amestolkiae]